MMRGKVAGLESRVCSATQEATQELPAYGGATALRPFRAASVRGALRWLVAP